MNIHYFFSKNGENYKKNEKKNKNKHEKTTKNDKKR